jgi:hypothetical protein
MNLTTSLPGKGNLKVAVNLVLKFVEETFALHGKRPTGSNRERDVPVSMVTYDGNRLEEL